MSHPFNHRARIGSLTAGIYFVSSVVVVGQSGPAQAANTPCTIKAYSNDGDPKGQNIRASASSKAKIIGHLPPVVIEDETTFGPYFDILAVQGDWAQIANAVSWNGGAPSKTLGWISTKLILSFVKCRKPVAMASLATNTPTSIDEVTRSDHPRALVDLFDHFAEKRNR